ncbi:hypothetical protein CTAYLR_005298 [Chrysophaeum taylorii]|uniref:PH domain-containing protein n=1 Tax=Chrysophaeum taylorii TaxID=2483200 RepID=A0AAD7UKZ2_9STRA|nr:hypothetical protein CTAYLR_005298 [Chrysophaeum taylorii]
MNVSREALSRAAHTRSSSAPEFEKPERRSPSRSPIALRLSSLDETDKAPGVPEIDASDFGPLLERMSHSDAKAWMKGYLLKKSANGPNVWLRRYFVLEPPMLYSYDVKGGKPVGLICVEGALTFLVSCEEDADAAPPLAVEASVEPIAILDPQIPTLSRMFRELCRRFILANKLLVGLISAGGKSHWFAAKTPDEATRWRAVLDSAQSFARTCSDQQVARLRSNLKMRNGEIVRLRSQSDEPEPRPVTKTRMMARSRRESGAHVVDVQIVEIPSNCSDIDDAHCCVYDDDSSPYNSLPACSECLLS